LILIAPVVRATLESKGTPVGPYGTLIAFLALSTKTTLVTHNTKEFKRIAKLNLEDWF